MAEPEVDVEPSRGGGASNSYEANGEAFEQEPAALLSAAGPTAADADGGAQDGTGYGEGAGGERKEADDDRGGASSAAAAGAAGAAAAAEVDGGRVGSGEHDEGDDNSGNQYVVLKFLLSTEAAGSIIGKNGVTVGELQVQSGTKIQLSKAREFFPGTSERMMLLCGSISNVLVALHLVLTKLLADEVPMLTSQGTVGEVSQLAMVVPHRLCGGIIGRAGATINSFMEDSGATLSVSPHNEACGFGERTVYVTGGRESQLRAVALIATKMSEDRYFRTDEVPLSYATDGLVQMHPHHQAHHAGHPHHQRMPGMAPFRPTPAYHAGAAAWSHPVPAAEVGPYGTAHPAMLAPGHGPVSGMEAVALGDAMGPEAKAHYLLPEEAVGVIIGKAGRTIQSIRKHSGARVKIEDSTGTGQRLVVLTGMPYSVAAADQLLVAHLRQQGKEAALRRLGEEVPAWLIDSHAQPAPVPVPNGPSKEGPVVPAASAEELADTMRGLQVES